MSTEKQRAASRANAQHSTGPRTAQGKAASCYNALKHGIHAQSQVIFDENAEDLEQLTAEFQECYQPANAAERVLVDILIENDWRLRRMRRVEASLYNRIHHQIVDNRTSWDKNAVATATTGEVFQADEKKFLAINRIVTASTRTISRATKDLERLQSLRLGRDPDSDADPATPQPEESKPTSESPASFPTPAPEPDSAPVVAGHARPSPGLPETPDLPKAA